MSTRRRVLCPGPLVEEGAGNFQELGLRNWKFPFACLHSEPRGGISRPCCLVKNWGVSSAFEGSRPEPGRDAPLHTVSKGHLKDLLSLPQALLAGNRAWGRCSLFWSAGRRERALLSGEMLSRPLAPCISSCFSALVGYLPGGCLPLGSCLGLRCGGDWGTLVSCLDLGALSGSPHHCHASPTLLDGYLPWDPSCVESDCFAPQESPTFLWTRSCPAQPSLNPGLSLPQRRRRKQSGSSCSEQKTRESGGAGLDF